MNLPGYDAWKLSGPDDMSAEEEAAMEAERDNQEQCLRDAIYCALSDNRGEIYLATVREIVIEELNKLRPLAGEPAWQTQAPVPIPPLG